MKWFEGGIPQAIQEAKNNRSVFIVFISGEDEGSATMESFLHQKDVTDLCEASRCVAVKLVSNSNDCKYFSQIFPVVVIPSTFFIGDTGTPLEVIGECKTPEEFVTRVRSVISSQNQSVQSAAPGAQQESGAEPSHSLPQAQKTEAESLSSTNTSSNRHIDDAKEAEVRGASGGADESDEDAQSPEKKAKTTEMSVQEKVERAKELIETKREEKMRKEAEEAKRKELERRNVGQGVQQLRQTQKEMEMLEAKKELKKDRDDDKVARQRVKEQIARDRAEKNARFSQAKEVRDKALEEAKRKKLMEQQAAADAEQARRSDISRLQFRLPDGSSITQQFPATETFSAVHQFITGHMGCAMTLSTAYPRRTFTQADHNSTLQDLALAPSAVILVIPSSGSGSYGHGGSSGVVSGAVGITNLLFAPFVFLWNMIASILGLSSSASTPSSAATKTPATATGGERDSGGARPRGVSSSQQHGSIRRFHNADDDEDDEDRATWNGNSTQQM